MSEEKIPMNIQQMLRTHPDVRGNESEPLIRCIDECRACAEICTSCADACVAEKNVNDLKQCIRLDLDCADLCAATAALATRRTGSNEGVLRSALEICAFACEVCADECEKHASMHAHCRICAEACRSCQRACQEAMADVGGRQAH
jgi:hypothetical protein